MQASSESSSALMRAPGFFICDSWPAGQPTESTGWSSGLPAALCSGMLAVRTSSRGLTQSVARLPSHFAWTQLSISKPCCISCELHQLQGLPDHGLLGVGQPLPWH